MTHFLSMLNCCPFYKKDFVTNIIRVIIIFRSFILFDKLVAVILFLVAKKCFGTKFQMLVFLGGRSLVTLKAELKSQLRLVHSLWTCYCYTIAITYPLHLVYPNVVIDVTNGSIFDIKRSWSGIAKPYTAYINNVLSFAVLALQWQWRNDVGLY